MIHMIHRRRAGSPPLCQCQRATGTPDIPLEPHSRAPAGFSAQDPGFAEGIPATGQDSAWRATPTASGMHLQPRLGLKLLLRRPSSKCELPFAIAILAAGKRTQYENH